MPNSLLRMQGIRKSFGAVQALCGVDFAVRAGEVHAIVGENGAGKSTLMKIVSGALSADAGTIDYEGKPFAPRSPAHARRSGIAMIYQELMLAPHLSVAENITLGVEPQRFGWLRDALTDVKRTLEALGHGHIDPAAPVRSLGVGEQQIVEIARALLLDARLIIMDEPTSSLSAQDVEALFAVIRTLAARGVAIVYISHFLEEVRRIADGYTVLRDGMSVVSGRMADASLDEIIRAMVGRTLSDMFPRRGHAPADTVLSAKDLSSPPSLVRAGFSLRRGEIFGIAGLIGSGRTELLRCLYGLRKVKNGAILLRGKTLPGRHAPRRSLDAGIDLLSENRKEEGLAVSLPLRDNMTLSSLRRFSWLWPLGIIRGQREREAVSRQCAALGIRSSGIMQKTGDLSGGNQQKAALGRILIDESEVLLLDEPTRGIDVGSKVEIYRLIGDLACAGKAIIMVSSYLPELLGICDTLAVMHRGVLSPKRPVSEWTPESVMLWATSGKSVPRETSGTMAGD
jgi:ribose transport system ATP-binding protein